MQDSLLGQIVLSPEPWQFFKKEGSFNNPSSNIPVVIVMHKPNQICIVTNVSCLSVPSLCLSSDTDRDSRIVLSCSQWAREVVTTRLE